jgi:hypothetical protein
MSFKAPDRGHEPVKFCKFSEIYAKDLLEIIKVSSGLDQKHYYQEKLLQMNELYPQIQE